MKKTIFVLFLVLLMLSGCQKTETKTEEKTDLLGSEINIICDENNCTGFLWFSSDSKEAEEMRQRKEAIENKFNCKINIVNTETGIESFISSKTASNATGDADITLSLSYYVRRWGKAGYLTDIAEISDAIGFPDSFRWGDENDLETTAVGGTVYGVIPKSFPDNLKSFFYFIVTNDALVTKSTGISPDIYRENGLSREDLEFLVKNTYQPSDGIYGLDTGLESFLTTCIYSGGGSVYNEKTRKTGLRDAGTLEALSWGADFLDNNKAAVYLHDDYRDMFLSGKAALATADTAAITDDIADNTEIGRFSVFSFPKGPYATEETAAGYIHSYKHTIAVPKITSDADATAEILNEFFAPLSYLSSEEDLKKYYKNGVFWADEDVETVFGESAKGRYNYWQEGFHNIMTNIAEATVSQSPAAALSSALGIADNSVETTIKPNREGLKLYFE